MSEAPTEPGDASTPVKKPRRKILIFAIILVALILGIGASVFSMMAGGKKQENVETIDKEEAEKVLPTYYPIPNLLFNIPSMDGDAHYVRLSLNLELAKAEDIPLVEAATPRIVDSIQLHISELRIEDLQGASGIERLRLSINDSIRNADHHLEIKNVLIQELLLQ